MVTAQRINHLIHYTDERQAEFFGQLDAGRGDARVQIFQRQLGKKREVQPSVRQCARLGRCEAAFEVSD